MIIQHLASFLFVGAIILIIPSSEAQSGTRRTRPNTARMAPTTPGRLTQPPQALPFLALQSPKNASNELFPPPGKQAIDVCSFEAGGNCTLWKNGLKSDINFVTVGEAVRDTSKRRSTLMNYYITTPPRGKGTARLTTGYLTPVSVGFKAFCISFLYKIKGNGATKLMLFERNRGNTSERQFWQVTGDQQPSDEWRFHTSQVTSQNPVKISFAALVTQNGDDADEIGNYVALDDVTVYNGTCYIRDGDTTQPQEYRGQSRGLVTTRVTWTGRQIPYVISFGFNANQMTMMNRFFEEVATRTCVRWVERTNQIDYVKIVKVDSGCITDLGQTGGAQLVQLANECFDYATLSHTLLHVVGLRHEHIRSDRDRFVRYIENNVIDPANNQRFFAKRPPGADPELEAAQYDKQSVMHFPGDLYAISGRKVLESLTNRNEQLGNVNGPTASDYQKVANLYCSGTTRRPDQYWTEPTTTGYYEDNVEDEYPCRITKSETARSGTITSYLRADGYYRTGESCGWLIRVATGRAIKIEIMMIDIERTRSCSSNYLAIYDGGTEAQPALVKLCGNQNPVDAFVTSGNQALVKFVTSSSGGSGFRLQYREVSWADDLPNSALSPLDCSFDYSQCSWLDATSGTSRWIRSKVDEVDSFDHTTQSVDGSYMVVDASTITGSNRVHVMRGPRVASSDMWACLSFFYRFGDSAQSIGNLELVALLSPSNLEKILWSSSSGNRAPYSDWSNVLVPLSDSILDYASSYRLSFRATIRRRTAGGIGVDDVVLTQESCNDVPLDEWPADVTTQEPWWDPVTTRPTRLPRPTAPTNTPSGNLLQGCDFEASLCNWQNSQRDDIDWVRRSGKSSPGSNYGVSNDNTRGTIAGQYLLVNSNAKGVARLEMEVQSSAGYKCFEFFYMMYGRNVGRLAIKVLQNSNNFEQLEMIIFEATGNKPNKWLNGRASIDGLQGSYTLQIEAYVTGNQDGDIAIDDIGFRTSSCYVNGPPPVTTTPYFSPPNVYFCDFEAGDLCPETLQFTNDDFRASLQWTSQTPADVRSFGGPSQDKSTLGPYGTFAAVLGGRSGGRASMSTRTFGNNEQNCMTFWYYMGSGVQETTQLQVYQVPQGQAPVLLGTYRGTSDNTGTWINPQVVIRQNMGEFSIRFVVTASSSRSLLVLDDVALSRNDRCSPISRLMPIPGRKRRQANFDYQDSSASTTPRTRSRALPSVVAAAAGVQTLWNCRFGDGNFCGWTASSQWKVVSTSVDQNIAGPDDRFAHVSTGRLMVAAGNSRSLPMPAPGADMTSNVTGVLTTPSATAMQACLRFWWKVAGWFRDLPMDTLNVYVRSGSSRRMVASFSGSMTPGELVDEWVEQRLTLFEPSTFSISFEAMTGDSWMGSLAIDDVILRTAVCPRAGI